jgi:hypothetical protein
VDRALSPRWRLVARVAPLVAVAVAAKLGFDLAGWGDSIVINPLLTGLVAANVFLLGFLLAGTLADYKESERLPGELGASLESITDECQILHEDKQAEPARECMHQVQEVAVALRDWFNRRIGVDKVLDELAALNPHFLAFEPLTQANFIVRLKQEQAAIRRMVIRINTIRETSFVGAGYAVAELTSALLVAILLFVEITPLGASLFFVGLITFLLAYMILLIKDLDDPFEYRDGERNGAAEVSLDPLLHVERRIAGIADRHGPRETAGVA